MKLRLSFTDARSDVIGLWISGFIETFVASFEAQAAAGCLQLPGLSRSKEWTAWARTHQRPNVKSLDF